MNLYTSNALAKAAGVSYRQINHWTTRGYIEPVSVNGTPTNGTGNKRIYDDRALLKARLLGYLFDPDIAGKLASDLAEHKAARLPGFAFAMTEWSIGPHRTHAAAKESA